MILYPLHIKTITILINASNFCLCQKMLRWPYYLLYSLNRVWFPDLCFKKQIRADPTFKNQSNPPQQVKEAVGYFPWISLNTSLGSPF